MTTVKTQTVITTSPEAVEIIKEIQEKIANSPTGVSFFAVKGYQNEQGEISNYVINVGSDFEKAKKADIKFLQNLKVATIKDAKSDVVLLEQARQELLKALIEPSKTRSEGQTDAYEHIAPNVKRHLTNGNLYVFGTRVNKNVLVKGTYPVVNSRPLTIAKDEIRELLKSTKYRQFKLDLYEINFKVILENEIDVTIYGQPE